MSHAAATALSPALTADTWVYSFGRETAADVPSDKALLGGKGANLAEMCRLGLPVPPGFVLTTEVCRYFYAQQQAYPQTLTAQVEAALAQLEKETVSGFGHPAAPLLLAVRSGARVSMPGMMDTILNIGLNDTVLAGLAAANGGSAEQQRFAWDCYRRLLQMYGSVVMGVSHDHFEDILDTFKRRNNLRSDTAIDAAGWQDIVGQYKQLIEREAGKPFPQDPKEQLWGAIGAVFKSWMTHRAVTYRKINSIPAEWGTAVCVQAVVFGNQGDDCATGVAFTRDPSTGENVFYGEYLVNAQGEDVVAGIRTPDPIATLADKMPQAYAELLAIRDKLERHYHDMQDIEFTIQRGKLYMLQTRNGKRSAAAAIRIAVEMANQGVMSREDAILAVDPASLDQLLHPTIDQKASRDVLTRGLPASPGAAVGTLVFDPDRAEKLKADGIKTILCRIETSPEDIHGMHAAEGILTARGGMTSHAAVVARGMGKPCVSGAGDLHIDYAARHVSVNGHTLGEGDVVTIDGSSGEVIAGAVAMRLPELSEYFLTLMDWADDARRLRIRANAETPLDAKTARGFGAEGIGLCRTEHMFFDPARILHVRRMILAENTEDRASALAALAPAQQADFEELFTIMDDLPVTIRLLDPPLHEFLPQQDAEIAALAQATGRDIAAVKSRIQRLHETNPMLGLRGVRLGVVYPEIYDMQVKAIFAAAVAVKAKEMTVRPEIMVPLIATAAEMKLFKARIDALAPAGLEYMVGTMIELPRAALNAAAIAEDAAFFSFGTNDLTQTTWGISRDDAGSFLPSYQQQALIAADPFASLDIDGVGQLVRLAADSGRKTRADIKLGVCGEHGGDPASIAFFNSCGLEYVSCSPYRVPIARLAAARAAIQQSRKAA